ncbi:MAG: hypothetical protein KDJ19_00755 [Hyphomicrobiaceae bacterium]|nr:hypothetical protein [Hyphomicrobiaceae bacterium]MCC0024638.1 hypothetical protein [Hyphomicrobiaceae bacterium]
MSGVFQHYAPGTISIANGSTSITGSGTEFEQYVKGDVLIAAGGIAIMLAENPTSDTAATAMQTYTGTSISGAAYSHLPISVLSALTTNHASLISLLGSGAIPSLGTIGASATAGQFLRFAATDVLELVSSVELVSGVATDEKVETLAERSAYDAEAADFSIYVADVGDGRAAIYYKQSATSGDWSDPGYLTGDAGEPGGYRHYYDAVSTSEGVTSNGAVRFNHADPTQATKIWIDSQQIGGENCRLGYLPLSLVNATTKGLVHFRNQDGSKALLYAVTGYTAKTGYFELDITYQNGSAPTASEYLFGQPSIYGSDGADGNDGADGATILLGSGAPDDGDGSNGDIYFDLDNGDVYSKSGGTWGTADGNIAGSDGAAAVSSGTSTTSIAIGTGSKGPFTTQAGIDWVVGSRIRLVSDADTGNYMEGQISDYTDTDLTVDVDLISGSGTHADWSIAIAGDQGAPGTNGDGLSGTQVEVSTSKTLTAPDKGVLQVFTGTAETTWTLTSAATLGASWLLPFVNRGSDILTIEVAGSSGDGINEETSLDFTPGEAGIVYCDGTSEFRVQIMRAAGTGSATPGFIVPHENLRLSSSDNVSVDVTADNLELINSITGEKLTLADVDVTANISTTGADGRDTATAEASSTWYYTYVIAKTDGADVASLLSTQSSYDLVTLPTDYVFIARVGAVYNNSSGNIVAIEQTGTLFRLANTSYVAILDTGTATSMTALDLSEVCPIGAKATHGIVRGDYAAANTRYTEVGPTNAGSLASGVGGYNATRLFDYFECPIIEDQTIYYRVSNATDYDTNISIWGGEY